MGEGLVTEGKTRLRTRRASPQTITEEQFETFFATLAETCNVVRSAKAAGFSSSWAYRLRQHDAAFRNGWGQAVREGYAKLELMLLERAMKGTPRPIQRRDGSERIIREYSTQLAVALLRRHAEVADSAAYEPGGDEMRDLRDKILAKLERVREREQALTLPPPDGGGALQHWVNSAPHCSGHAGGITDPMLPHRGEGLEDAPIETKAAADRIGLILWAVKRQARQALTPLAFGESPASGEASPRLASGRPGDDRPDAPETGEGFLR